MAESGLVDVADTRLFVEQRGSASGFPLIVLHGGPGLDHHMYGNYLDPLTSDARYRLLLVDQRGQGMSDRESDPSTWTLERMVADVTALAETLGLDAYAVLGHSFGAFVALQHAVDFPGAASGTVVSAGVASAHWLAGVEAQLAAFEPESMRERVVASWAHEATVETEAEVAELMRDQMPFHFHDPLDSRLGDYAASTAGTRYAPDVLRHFAVADYGGIEVEDELQSITQPVLVLSGRHDRTCPAEAGADMAARIPGAELVVFESSAHMTFVEEPEAYISAVGAFLDRLISSTALRPDPRSRRW